ncbi:MAG: aminotransferase class I/II-fold pyridoxal phosphate-dependent enzyme, partial [Pyrinomonadaceae bacterium]
FRARRDYLLATLDGELGLRAVVPDGAFYAMVEMGAFGSSMQVAEAMLEQGVITVPGAAFGVEGEGFLRLSFCADRPALAEGLSRMDRALRALRK